jgi:hypothetical protein
MKCYDHFTDKAPLPKNDNKKFVKKFVKLMSDTFLSSVSPSLQPTVLTNWSSREKGDRVQKFELRSDLCGLELDLY